jgi:hypothetical protein
MTRARKLALAASLVALAVTVALCWPKPRGYTYQGKTPEEWFEEILKQPTLMLTPPSAADEAFTAMGTNAAPFLVRRFALRRKPSLFERWTSRFTSSIEKRRDRERNAAAFILSVRSQAPSDMVKALFRANDLPVIEENEPRLRKKPLP